MTKEYGEHNLAMKMKNIRVSANMFLGALIKIIGLLMVNFISVIYRRLGQSITPPQANGVLKTQ